MKVFLTGATGFLGGELAVALSKLDRVSEIWCMVRPKEGLAPDARLERVFAFHSDCYDTKRIRLFEGDLQDAGLAARLKASAELADVSLVIHAAAQTSFLPAKQSVIDETNIRGTGRMLDWATELRGLDTFAYIGTATVAGANANLIGKTIYESDTLATDALHLVGYTRSKMLAELDVRAALPPEQLLVIRPGMLVGDSRDIVPRSFDIAWVVIAVLELGIFFGDPESACDMIPIDYCVNAIVRLLTANRQWLTYHVSAGDRATSPRQVIGAIGPLSPEQPPFAYAPKECLPALKHWLRGEDPAVELRPYADQLAHIDRVVTRKRARLMLFGLEAYWQFANLSQRFDCTRMLQDTGLGHPEPAHEYLKRGIKYLRGIDAMTAAVNPFLR